MYPYVCVAGGICLPAYRRWGFAKIEKNIYTCAAGGWISWEFFCSKVITLCEINHFKYF